MNRQDTRTPRRGADQYRAREQAAASSSLIPHPSSFSSGDLFIAVNDDASWGGVFELLLVDQTNAAFGFFTERDGRPDQVFRIAFDRLSKPNVVADDAPPPPSAQSAKSVPARQGSSPSAVKPGGSYSEHPDAYYRHRSRTTARQRAAAPSTAKQHTYLVQLGRRQGFDIEDLRRMTRQGSLKKLSIQEASELIDRLKGRGAAAQSAPRSRRAAQ